MSTMTSASLGTLPQIWQNTDCFPVGPQEYACHGLQGGDQLCIRMAGALRLKPYDTSYKREYLGLPVSGLEDPRVELIRTGFPGEDATARLEIFPDGGDQPAATVHVRFVSYQDALELRFGARCPTCQGRHRQQPCPWEVYVTGARLVQGATQ